MMTNQQQHYYHIDAKPNVPHSLERLLRVRRPLEPWFVEHPCTPQTLGFVDFDDVPQAPVEMMNRNARRGKRANKGKRPVSRQRRRSKKRAFGNHRR